MDIVIFTTYDQEPGVRERALSRVLAASGVRCRFVRVVAPDMVAAAPDAAGVVVLPRDEGSPEGQRARSAAFRDWVGGERPDWVFARGNKIDLLYDLPAHPGFRRGVIIGGGHRDHRFGRLDLAFAESRPQARSVARRWPLLPIAILPKYVPPVFFSSARSERSIDVVGVGRHDLKKNYGALIPLFSGPRRIHLVGDGPEHRRLLNAASDRPGVRFTRWADQDTVARLFGDARVLAHPSRYEGFPRVLCEAMAAGCVPVFLRSAVDSRLLDPGNSVACRDEASLLAAVDRLLDDDALRARLAAGARATASDRFSEKALGDAADLFVRLLSSGRGARWWVGWTRGHRV